MLNWKFPSGIFSLSVFTSTNPSKTFVEMGIKSRTFELFCHDGITFEIFDKIHVTNAGMMAIAPTIIVQKKV